MDRISAIILAGGKGERFGSTIPKHLMSLNGKPVIQYCLDVIEPLVDEVIIVGDQYKNYKCVVGGRTRQESVYNALQACSNPKWVLVHDSVRPMLSSASVRAIIASLKKGAKSVGLGTKIVDGLFYDGKPVRKDGYWLGHTPEGFDFDLLLRAHQTAREHFQDDRSLFYHKYRIEPDIIEGPYLNQKITYDKDLENMEAVMRYFHEPLEGTIKKKKVLLLGGSGGIGTALKNELEDYDAPTRTDLDLSTIFDIDLHSYDAICHCAGEYFDHDRIMPVNFESAVRLIDIAREQKWKGNMVFISSTASTYGRAGIGLYSSSKSALNTYIESAHNQLAEEGIYVNIVAPAKVDTKLQATINPDTPKDQMMTPEYVAKRILPYLDTDKHGMFLFLRKGFDDSIPSRQN